MPSLQDLRKILPKIGRLCSIPAGMMDRAYLEEPSSFVGRLYSFIKIRAIYIFLFIPASFLDMVSSGVIAIGAALGSLFSIDDAQNRLLNQQKKFATRFSENLFALLSIPFGVVSPKVGAFYFTPEQPHSHGVTAGGVYHHANDAVRLEPESIEAIQDLVREASAAGDKIIPVGAGRSQGKQFIPADGQRAFVIDLHKLNSIEVNARAKIARVGAGVRWADLQAMINQHKLALKVMQASNVFSVGGSIGTNIHGWDHRTGSLSNTIVSLDIINAQGELQTIYPDNPLFHHVVGGFGLYGIVVSAEISLTDNELLVEQGQAISPADYVRYFHEEVMPDDSQRMHLYRLSLDPDDLLGSGVAVSYVKQDNQKPLVTPNLSVEESKGSRFNRFMVNLARRFDFIRRIYWSQESARLINNNNPPQSTNEIMQPPIKAMFNPSVSEAEWLQEYFLPGDQLDAFLKNLGRLLMNNEVVLLNASVRFVKQHAESPLSYARDGDRFAVVLCFNQSLQKSEIIKCKKWLRESQALAVWHGGTYYLPYQHVSSPEDFAAAYPAAGDAQQYKNQVDPNHIFTSGFHQKYLSPQPDTVNPFKTMRSNPQFQNFLRAILSADRLSQLNTLLDDVLSYNDTHEEIYRELVSRLSELPSSITETLRRTLTQQLGTNPLCALGVPQLNEDSLRMAQMIQTLFNAVHGVAVSQELDNSRKFQPVIVPAQHQVIVVTDDEQASELEQDSRVEQAGLTTSLRHDSALNDDSAHYLIPGGPCR
jgi:FAD/FMN-containing dehydrogenase